MRRPCVTWAVTAEIHSFPDMPTVVVGTLFADEGHPDGCDCELPKDIHTPLVLN